MVPVHVPAAVPIVSYKSSVFGSEASGGDFRLAAMKVPFSELGMWRDQRGSRSGIRRHLEPIAELNQDVARSQYITDAMLWVLYHPTCGIIRS